MALRKVCAARGYDVRSSRGTVHDVFDAIQDHRARRLEKHFVLIGMELPHGEARSARGMDREGDVRIIAFETAERAAEMQAWIDESKIAERPMPKLGPSREDMDALREASLRWGFGPGATRRVVQAYRHKMAEDGEGPGAEMAATDAVIAHTPPNGAPLDVARFIVQWAKEHHRDWFYRRRVRVDDGKDQG